MYGINKSLAFSKELKNMLPGAVHSNFHGKNNVTNLCMNNANGSRIWDIDENEYLDLFGQYGALILGHNCKDLNDSLHSALNRLTITSLEENTYRVCELLKKWFPHSDMVRFGLSGTEVIQNTFRLARAFTGRQKVVRFMGHFHGTADDVLGNEQNLPDNTPDPFSYDASFHTEGRREDALNQMLILPWNDFDAFKLTIQRESENIAAVIMEPIMCNGGGISADINYLRAVRELCSEYNVILIFDELITGIRNGPGGFQGEIGVIPDLTIVGKSITNGIFPLTCLLGKREIMNLYSEGKVVYAGTYNGYPLSMAAARTTLEILLNDYERIYDNLAIYSKQICNSFMAEAEKQGFPLVIQGINASPSFHVKSEMLNCYSDLSPELIMRNGILRTCMQANGILSASVSRLNMNIFLTDNDVEFFATNIKHAIEDARIIMRRKRYIV